MYRKHLIFFVVLGMFFVGSVTFVRAANDGFFDVNLININFDGSATDPNLNNTTETLTIWTALDGGQGPTGSVSFPNPPKFYNIANIVPDVEVQVDYGGGGGNFPSTINYNTINFNDGPGGGVGPIGGGDDFSVRGEGFLRFPVGGTYSISAGSDDGRRLELTHAGGPAGYAGFTARGEQTNIGVVGGDFLGFSGTTGHNRSTGVFSVTAGEILALDAHFFERGGGDSFEIAIKAGSDTTNGGPSDGWALVSNSAAGVDVSTNLAFSDTNLTVSAYNIVGGGGSNDNDLNNIFESNAIWGYIDGGGTTGLTPDLSVPLTYNIQNNVVDQETVIDYAGGGGNFPVNNAYSTINSDGPGGGVGPFSGGDDFSIRAQTFIEIKADGPYSIAALSDDGRRIELTEEFNHPASAAFTGFTAIGGQTGLGGVGQGVVGFNGTTGHNNTVGVFDAQAGDVFKLDSFFFERASGDSFEFAIKPGTDTGFGGPGDGWVLLDNTTLAGIMIDSIREQEITTTPGDTGTINFGAVRLGTSSASMALTAVNSGDTGTVLTGSIPASSGEFSSGAAVPFALTAFGPTADETATQNYTYTPANHGAGVADTLPISVTSDGVNGGGSSTVTLSGIGVGPEFSLKEVGSTISPGSLIDLSPPEVLQFMNSVTLTLENVTPDPDTGVLDDLTIFNATITGQDPNNFQLLDLAMMPLAFPIVLSAGASQDFILKFNGNALEVFTATLTFLTDQLAPGGFGTAGGDDFVFFLRAEVVPEPASLLIGLLGLLGMGWLGLARQTHSRRARHSRA